MDAADELRRALADRYAIERELGQGGMATVYLADDLRHHRKVALKVLRPEIAATLGAERFHREIQIAAQSAHQDKNCKKNQRHRRPPASDGLSQPEPFVRPGR